MVLPPMRLSFRTSDREATPETNEVMTSGTAMSLSKVMKIVPKGLIQSRVHCPQPWDEAIIPYTTPAIRAITICQ